MKHSINKKLAAGFGLCLLLIVTVVGFNYSALRKLEKLYLETLKHSGQMELAADAKNIGKEMYQIIADTLINRDLTKSDRTWVVCKKESLEKLGKVAKFVETPGERADVREAEQAIYDIIRIYELEMLPLIHRGATVPGPLSVVDAQLDKRIAAIDLALQRVAQSMSEKNRNAELEYNVVLKQTHGFGLMISLAGVLAVIAIISLVTRHIVVPLTEITGAALEIKKGNYLVGLQHTSKDEIGVLSDAFRDMSQQVEKRTLELQASNERLQQEIGERRQAEEEISRLNAVLEERVMQRTEELEATIKYLQIEIVEREKAETRRQEAEQALREETIERLLAVEALRKKEQMLIQQSRQAAMGEMIGNIAHQWRQPLNTLGLISQKLLLFYDLGQFNREFLDKSVLHSMDVILHMSRTIDDFRNYFKPDKEKVEFKVAEAIANTLSLIDDSFKNQRIGIEIILKTDPAIFGYRNEFAQALLNILNNAREALTEREIDEPRVTIIICNEGDRAVVTVADNAGGIPEGIMDKIFDPYFTTKGPQQGTGVGLFMSKTIIEKNMGGRLTSRNITDGAEFRIEV